MGHKCFISYKNENAIYKNKLSSLFESVNIDLIDNSLDYVIDSNNSEYILQVIRKEYLCDSTVTIFLIGKHSSENEGLDYHGRHKNYFIIRELQASLYDGKGNTRNGIVGIVLPEMYSAIYGGQTICDKCKEIHNLIKLNDNTVIREFHENYYIAPNSKCSWADDDRFCILVKWEDFILNPETFVEQAYKKREQEISNKVKVRCLHSGI